MPATSLLTKESLVNAAEILAARDRHLASIYERHGPPPMWARRPGFPTLLRIILEQQVSLASAKACFDKLTAHLGEITPANLLTIN